MVSGDLLLLMTYNVYICNTVLYVFIGSLKKLSAQLILKLSQSSLFLLNSLSVDGLRPKEKDESDK